MSSDLWTEETDGKNVTPPPAGAVRSRARLWTERAVIGLIAAISLLLPILFGLLFYLAVTDGLVINADNPLHEMRLWMVQERRGATGLGFTITSPVAGVGTAQCARTDVTFLKWDRSLRLETDADYCRCFERKGGQFVETTTPCP